MISNSVLSNSLFLSSSVSYSSHLSLLPTPTASPFSPSFCLPSPLSFHLSLSSLPPTTLLPSLLPSLLWTPSLLQATPDLSDGTGGADEGGTRACKIDPRGGKEVPEADAGSPEKARGSRRGEASCPPRAEDEGLAEPQEQH